MNASFQAPHPLVLPRTESWDYEVSPLSHAALPGVDVLAYSPNSLVFAQIAAAMTRSRDYSVLVDLPARMNREPGTLNLPLALLPLLSIVIYPAVAGTGRLSVPVSPASPPVVAALVARQRELPLRCIEPQSPLPNSHAFCPDVSLPEDYRVYQDGMERHFAGGWSALQSVFAKADAETQLFAVLRAVSVLSSVQAYSQRRRLLVVHWQLWCLMCHILDGTISNPPPNVKLLAPPRLDQRATLYLPDPERAWAWGLIDDYPTLVHAFFESHLAAPGAASVPAPASNVLVLPRRRAWRPGADCAGSRQGATFDKRMSLDRLLVDLATTEVSVGQAGTTRQRLAFLDYLRRLMAAAGRVIPRAAEHTLFAARACGGASFARKLRLALLAYPRPPAMPSAGHALPSLDELFTGSGRSLTGRSTQTWSREEQMRHEELLAAQLEQPGALQHILGQRIGGAMFTVPSEYMQYERIVAAVQRRSRRVQRVTVNSRPYAGSVKTGIDHKATMRSYLAVPQGQVFVRCDRLEAAEKVDRWTATVFLLDSEDNINRSVISPVMDASPAKHRMLFGQAPIDGPHDHVFTIMPYVTERKRLHDGHVQRDVLTAVGFLFASRLMGSERWALALARSREPCRTNPDLETAWGPFGNTESWTKTDRLLAWSLKYGQGRSVVVCAPSDFRPSARVATYAALRRKRLTIVPKSSVPASLLDRLRNMLLVSSNLRAHPQSDCILNSLMELDAPC